MPAWPRVALALGLALAAVACSQRPMQKATAPLPGLDGNPHQRITALWTEVRQWRLDANLDAEPDGDTVAAMSTMPATEAAGTCAAPAPTGGTCGDVCQLGDSICANALAICHIADELEGDAWAHDKCDSAKASCHQAEARCCECRRPTLEMP